MQFSPLVSIYSWALVWSDSSRGIDYKRLCFSFRKLEQLSVRQLITLNEIYICTFGFVYTIGKFKHLSALPPVPNWHELGILVIIGHIV